MSLPPELTIATTGRPSTMALRAAALLALGWVAMGVHALMLQREAQARHVHQQALVQQLSLTDMAWFNEARYTRHPALSDLHTPFQDAPGGVEHFPSGSVVPVPRPVAPQAPSDTPESNP